MYLVLQTPLGLVHNVRSLGIQGYRYTGVQGYSHRYTGIQNTDIQGYRDTGVQNQIYRDSEYRYTVI